METYIVRIYRKGAKHPNGIAGLVEDVSMEQTKGFASVSELCRILDLPSASSENGTADPNPEVEE